MMAQEKLRPEDIDSAIAQTTQTARSERAERALEDEGAPLQTNWLDDRDEEADIPDFPEHDFRVEDDEAVAVSEAPATPRRTMAVVGGGIGLLIVAGLVWWMFRPVSHGAGEVPVVSAEPGDVKTKPTDEGGMDVPGQDLTVYGQIGNQPAPDTQTVAPQPEAPIATGQTAPMAPSTPAAAPATPAPAADTTAQGGSATTEGQSQIDAVLAEMRATGTPAPAAGAASPAAEVQPAAGSTQTAAAPGTQPAATAAAPAAAAGAVRIQLAAFKSESQAQDASQRLQRSFQELSSQTFHVERADLGAKGIYYRVQAGPLASRDEATAVCARLKQHGQSCILVAP
jgi:hypothetical protein